MGDPTPTIVATLADYETDPRLVGVGAFEVLGLVQSVGVGA